MARPRKTVDTENTSELEITTVRKSPRKRKPKVHDDGGRDEQPGKPPRKSSAKAKAPLDGSRLLDDSIPDLSMNRSRVTSTSLAGRKVISEADILAADTPAQLVALVNSLVSTQQDQIFADYKSTTQLQQTSDSKLISTLRRQLETKQNTIDTLAAQLNELQGREHVPQTSSTPQRSRPQDMYESPIRKQASSSSMIHRDDMDHELKTISFTFDMLELLTGVRIVNYEEDTDKFYFDVKQSSTILEPEVDAVFIEYRLVINRQFEATAEVTYVPMFLKDLNKKARDAEQESRNRDARKLVPFLPEYLQDNLKFPYNTLSQFYTKLSKALNRSARS